MAQSIGNEYYFDDQIGNYILQFMALFTDLQVRTGKREDGKQKAIRVPIVYGSRDRVTAAVVSENTQNKPIQLPTMSAWWQNIHMGEQRRKGVDVVTSETYLPRGGQIPDDITNLQRRQPIPYDLEMELSIHSANQHEQRQLLEQLLMVFDPIVQLQKNDDSHDWTRLTMVELMNVNIEENYPAAQDRRHLVSTLHFKVPIWIAPPLNYRRNIVENAKLRIAAIDHSETLENAFRRMGTDPTLDLNEIVLESDIPSEQVGDDCD